MNNLIKIIRDNSVFKVTLAFLGMLIFLFVFFPAAVRTSISYLNKTTLSFFGNFYLYLGFIIVCLCVLIAFLPIGNQKLTEVKPEHSWVSWVAMLFSTGMGPGLMLRAVQEPTFYYLHPPTNTLYDLGDYALAYTFFHWGITPWAFYSFFGLIITYNLASQKDTVLVSNFFNQFKFSAKLKTPIDSLIIISTVVGIVASLGLGGRQILGGFLHLTKLDLSIIPSTIVIVLILVAISILSAMSGIGKSIKYISNFNLGLMFVFMIFVAAQSDFFTLANRLMHALGIYFKDFAGMSLNVGIQKTTKTFLLDWTYFYWAFWLSWVPFTGIFIARVSKGRTIRQFLLGTLLLPSLATFFWFTAFGATLFSAQHKIIFGTQIYDSIYSSIFIFLDSLPLHQVTQPLALVLVVSFLITSIDSAVFVLAMVSAGGEPNPQKSHRLIWGTILGLMTISFLILGKESLLESTSQLLILFSIPLSILYLIMILRFLRKVLKF